MLATSYDVKRLERRGFKVRQMTWRAISVWPDPSALFGARGVVVVRQRAAEGDREAQFSLGYALVCEADEDAGATLVGASGRSPTADVGLAL